jgi:site-specific recombinase XerD
MTAKAPTALASALRAFLAEHLPATRGLSPCTIRSYRDAFVLLLRFLAARHAVAVVDIDLAHLAPEDVIAFLDHLESDRGNGVATRNARLAAVRSFARFLAMRSPEHVESCQRLLAIPVKRAGAREVEYLEEDEIEAMLHAIDRRTAEGRRDYALLLVMFNTGARVQEILDVRVTDLQLERPFLVRLRGKGRKERVCPLWPETVDALRPVIEASDRDGGPSYLFRNRRRERLTRFGVRHILRRCAARASGTRRSLVRRRIHPHVIRHTTAVHLLRSGVDVVTIRDWLGHASVETTNRYAVVDLDAKRRALEKARPPVLVGDADLQLWRTDASVLDWLERL